MSNGHAVAKPGCRVWPGLGGRVLLGLILGLAAGCSLGPKAHEREESTGQWSPVARARAITIEQTVGRGTKLEMTSRAESVRWAPGGRYLVRGDRWEDALTGEAVRPEPAAEESGTSESAEALVASLVANLGLEPDVATRVARRARWADSSRVAVLVHRQQLYAFRVDPGAGDSWIELGPIDGSLQPEVSPDGESVAFARSHDLFVKSTRGDEEFRLSEDGSEELLYGRLDWVYQEEIFGRGNWQGVWWSPDSSALAFLRLDESAVPEYVIADERPARPVFERQRYPKAGEPNPTVSVAVWRKGSGVTWCDLGEYPKDCLIVGVSWGGSRCTIQVQDRIQTWLDLVEVEASGEVRSLVHETSPQWVNVLDAPRWLEDGSFLWRSERTGFAHLYHYDADGSLIRPLTAGEWSVRQVLRVDEKARVVWCVGSDKAIEEHVYRASLEGGGAERVTREPGTHRCELNATGSLLLDRFSSVTEPPRVRLIDAEGIVRRTFEAAALTDDAPWSLPELCQVPARDGVLLDALLIRPVGFDPSRVYPVWLSTYSGPASPSVENRWQESIWDQFLAQEGYVVLRANVRSASGRAQVDTATCYQRLGVQELADLEDVVDWLCAEPWADGARVGITGWSYGGFMAAYALTHSDRFRLGVAGAGVYDWRCYDTIYTERYMKTPQLNPQGYSETSCVEGAENLSGHLVIVHGTRDDNVHLQNAMQLLHALQKAGKDDFELMLYPGARHSIGDPDQRWHLRRLTWRAMERWLSRPVSASGQTSESNQKFSSKE